MKGGKVMANKEQPAIDSHAAPTQPPPNSGEYGIWGKLGVRFRRQYAVGHYIPDFCSPKAKLIIELDGSQHLEQEQYDSERTKGLESQGYRVPRFWNNDVRNNIDGVLNVILSVLNEQERDQGR